MNPPTSPRHLGRHHPGAEEETPRGVARHRLTPDTDVLTHEIDISMDDATELTPFLRARYERVA